MGSARRRFRRRPCRRAPTRSPTSSRSRASPTCCCNPGAAYRLQRPARSPIPTSGWSTGRAAIRSITTRTSTGCARPGASPRRSWCTSSSGRRPRGMADIVLPATTTLERDDIGAGPRRPISDRHAEAARADRRGARRLRDLRRARRPARRRRGLHRGPRQPWSGCAISTSSGAREVGRGRRERPAVRRVLGRRHGSSAGGRASRGDASPISAPIRTRHPLKTPSGKIEIFSETIASFGYDDCPGHPAWLEPDEWLGSPAAERFPLHMLSHQPRDKLHSQLDHGPHSQSAQGRGPPADHAASRRRRRARHRRRRPRARLQRPRRLPRRRGVSDASARVSPSLSTGAWFDPRSGAIRASAAHGNPNALTADRPSSKLSQGCTGQLPGRDRAVPIPAAGPVGHPPTRHRMTAPRKRICVAETVCRPRPCAIRHDPAELRTSLGPVHRNRLALRALPARLSPRVLRRSRQAIPPRRHWTSPRLGLRHRPTDPSSLSTSPRPLAWTPSQKCWPKPPDKPRQPASAM